MGITSFEYISNTYFIKILFKSKCFYYIFKLGQLTYLVNECFFILFYFMHFIN